LSSISHATRTRRWPLAGLSFLYTCVCVSVCQFVCLSVSLWWYVVSVCACACYSVCLSVCLCRICVSTPRLTDNPVNASLILINRGHNVLYGYFSTHTQYLTKFQLSEMCLPAPSRNRPYWQGLTMRWRIFQFIASIITYSYRLFTVVLMLPVTINLMILVQ
jgi:hypothetical protein